MVCCVMPNYGKRTRMPVMKPDAMCDLLVSTSCVTLGMQEINGLFGTKMGGDTLGRQH